MYDTVYMYSIYIGELGVPGVLGVWGVPPLGLRVLGEPKSSGVVAPELLRERAEPRDGVPVMIWFWYIICCSNGA